MTEPKKHVSDILVRVVPIGMALFPIGLLFGFLAHQLHWTVLDIVVMDVIGFTGSGQFAHLRFNQDGVTPIVAFLVILSINLRYIPMALSASRPLKLRFFSKALAAHFVSDESYATERREDDVTARLLIRCVILFFWTLSTVCGLLLAGIMPSATQNYFTGITFPISALLFTLSYFNIEKFMRPQRQWNGRLSVTIGICLVFAVTCNLLVGSRYFWIPSIAVCFGLLFWADSRRVQR
ncbi:MAG TPA: AzlC family ABC transporter permease [Dongiaceae bacterium]|nr:AzlC family ABC transporter permease [Dongiaceae bacterium]